MRVVTVAAAHRHSMAMCFGYAEPTPDRHRRPECDFRCRAAVDWCNPGVGRTTDVLPKYCALVETSRLNGVDRRACLKDTPRGIADHEITRLDELMPSRYAPS